jgi:tRNA C32,U32 (ribose-2'-O)-methylase TrmJ
LIGGEGQGLPEEVVDQADLKISIPMAAPVESLNAAVAAAVLLYEARRQRGPLDRWHGATHRQPEAAGSGRRRAERAASAGPLDAPVRARR